eukprot:CAMPEP_0202943564 /NCGR_PEP_ID=MMETSP1395-20130829/4043_1 /ASSEMBLY_ACC=CAM_ASM_000871 /TAXON_ID=5961 /ORGANISM="Blepharisma japonicum, Strain Stock R1072" /LENGTH=200 /DNA_ID=CAMNT_0049641187 /DNA_START=814 /DNA_END=1416 /DNA_ORIENTATION=-
MLALDPAQRLTIEQIKAHPWYNGPTATAEEVGNELRARRQRIQEAAERAREQRLKSAAGQRPGIVCQGGRFYRGDDTGVSDLSLSFSIPQEDLVAKPLPANFQAVTKYSQMLTGLSPQEAMTIISICLSDYQVECEMSQGYYEVTANVITETDVVNFKVTVYDAGNSMTLVSFDLLKGSKFDLMNIYRKVEERIQEVQCS